MCVLSCLVEYVYRTTQPSNHELSLFIQTFHIPSSYTFKPKSHHLSFRTLSVIQLGFKYAANKHTHTNVALQITLIDIHIYIYKKNYYFEGLVEPCLYVFFAPKSLRIQHAYFLAEQTFLPGARATRIYMLMGSRWSQGRS